MERVCSVLSTVQQYKVPAHSLLYNLQFSSLLECFGVLLLSLPVHSGKHASCCTFYSTATPNTLRNILNIMDKINYSTFASCRINVYIKMSIFIMNNIHYEINHPRYFCHKILMSVLRKFTCNSTSDLQYCYSC